VEKDQRETPQNMHMREDDLDLSQQRPLVAADPEAESSVKK